MPIMEKQIEKTMENESERLFEPLSTRPGASDLGFSPASAGSVLGVCFAVSQMTRVIFV